MKRLKTSVLLFLFAGSIFVLLVPTIFAAGTTTWTATPQHVTEGSTVNILLTLRGYAPSHAYYYIVNVTDPAGLNSSTNRTITTDSSGNGVLTIHYSSDFNKGAKASTNFTGLYTASVYSTSASSPSGSITFTVGLTDQLSYQRSLKARITAYGYVPGNETTVSLTKGATTIFSHSRHVVNASGYVNDFWNIPVIAGTDGGYTVTIIGNLTSSKTPSDTQAFTVIPAVLAVSNLNPATSSGKLETNLVRGNTTYAIFNVTYPNGTAVTNLASRSFVLLLAPGSGSTAYDVNASYSTTVKAFFTTTPHTYPINDPTGTWSLRVVFNQTFDSYGNRGPFNNVTVSFPVSPLTLNTAITGPGNKSVYSRTSTFNITATVSYPTSDTFGSSNPVYANLTGGTFTPVKLVFNSTSQKWQGTLTIPPDFPTGFAALQISAHDNYGNKGTNSSLLIQVMVTTIIVRQVPFTANGTDFYPFQTLSVHINASYVNNQNLTQATGAAFKITFYLPAGKSIAIPLTLQANKTLTGQYLIRDTDPLGRWNLTIIPSQLNDGYGNTNSKSFLGPIITILPLQLRFDSSYFKAPGNNTITGDKVTLGIAFLYPNGSSTQSLIVNTTIFANGQNNTYTFTYDSGTMKYLTTIDTTGWAPGRYQVNITASFADYRGSHIVWLTVKQTPFLLGPIVGVLLILVIIGLGVIEYSRRSNVATES